MCMKCQILFSGKNKNNIYVTNMPSAEYAQRVLKVNDRGKPFAIVLSKSFAGDLHLNTGAEFLEDAA